MFGNSLRIRYIQNQVSNGIDLQTTEGDVAILTLSIVKRLRQCLVPYRYDYGVALFGIGLVATFVGQTGAHALMRHMQRRSVIIGAMASLMLLSTVVMYGEAAARIHAALHEQALWKFGDICT